MIPPNKARVSYHTKESTWYAQNRYTWYIPGISPPCPFGKIDTLSSPPFFFMVQAGSGVFFRLKFDTLFYFIYFARAVGCELKNVKHTPHTHLSLL